MDISRADKPQSLPAFQPLGRGTFGKVYRDRNAAVKKFKEPDFLIQELIILKYMKESMHVVKVREFSLSLLQIRMDLYDMSLKDLMLRYQMGFEQKESVFKDILKGISEMHSLELVHCDLKPANILLTINPLYAVICDPGLASLSHHGRFLQTPKGYRRPDNQLNNKLGQRQDLYSISVFCLEMFAGIMLKETITPERLREIIKEVSIPAHIKEVLTEFSKMESDKYPTARSVLIGLYKTDSILAMPIVTFSKPIISKEDDRYVYETIKERTEKQLIEKGKRGYIMLIERFNNRNYPVVPRTQYPLYIACVMLILSAMFGRHGFNYNSVMAITGNAWSREDINRVITDIVTKDELLNILLIAE